MGGWTTNRKLVVFESDDWGSNRIPSKEAFHQLVKRNILSKNDNYISDTLAKPQDLEMLFQILTSVKDSKGNYAVFTPFVNTSNPDFKKIKEHNFQQYFHIPFFETLKNTNENERVSSLWKLGIKAGTFIPAYHGREHLNVQLWMKFLQNNDKIVRKAFEYEFYAVPTKSLPVSLGAFRPNLYFENPTQIPFLMASLIEGAILMKSMLGIQPKVFCPANGITHSIFDETLSQVGIKAVVAKKIRKEPDGKGGLKNSHYSFGKINKFNQVHYFRNCGFEPIQSKMNEEFCLNQMKIAFQWGKPAIISTHRVNYIGSILPDKRAEGLQALEILLKKIIKNWPDAEFISSNDLIELLYNTKTR